MELTLRCRDRDWLALLLDLSNAQAQARGLQRQSYRFQIWHSKVQV